MAKPGDRDLTSTGSEQLDEVASKGETVWPAQDTRNFAPDENSEAARSEREASRVSDEYLGKVGREARRTGSWGKKEPNSLDQGAAGKQSGD